MEKWVEEDLIPIRSRVFTHLKNAIVTGEYKAGERLVERELAEKLKISRTPIREALLRLESIGFVETVPRKGVVVAEITVEEILEVFTILSSLEVLSVKLAAQKMGGKTKDEFEKMITNVNKVLSGEEKCDIKQFHLDIHETLFKAAKSSKLYEILMGLVDNIRAFAHLGYEMPGRQRTAMEEHRDILIAVYNQEVDKAMELTRIHIENSKKAYVDAIELSKQEQLQK